MHVFHLPKYILGISAVAALMAGCSGGSQISPSAGVTTPTGAARTMGGDRKVSPALALVVPSSVRTKAKLRHIGRTKALKPNCCALQKTLVVTDALGGPSYAGAASMFDYNSGEYLGTIAPPPEGWLEPQGACSDNNGNFYIANTAMSTVDEFTHSGTFVTAINDAGQYPVGCAFDRTTGRLAIDNIISTSGGSGSVSLASNGSIFATYYPSNMSRVYFNAYQGKTGTLWLDGTDASGNFQYDSMASDGTFTPVPITGGSIAFPGAVMWSGKINSIVVGDQDSSTFYWVSDTGQVTGQTQLQCQSGACDFVAATIKGPGIVAPDAGNANVARYAWPAGTFLFDYNGPDFVQPIGTTVSSNKS